MSAAVILCFICKRRLSADKFGLSELRKCIKRCYDCERKRNRERYAKNPKPTIERTKRYRQLNGNPIRTGPRIMYMVYRAIAEDKLVKKPCEVCGNNNVEAHHEDYSKPLTVTWLCRKHHRMLHWKID